ncbi:inositol monophosphatase [Ruficoccus sp. ZRK36]|uniref:inositol monophosphatase family protein n=1 Tax=Ruficoccus sp. ZRK36 TaxID=2866311 RepID=UPI001C72F95F|nr:inositol monophosphatase [Ruficoccus sp. ZRK36]QYY34860.1 inositol monophosphatase [Ruficoccus sp. ZRK36]
MKPQKRKPGRKPVPSELRHRINAGRVAVKNQIAFFEGQFGQVESQWKEDDTRVTFADFAISEKVFTELRRSFPHDDYCSEESNPEDEVMQLEAEYAWIIDPIDGTNNYALGVPMCGISLALLRNGEPIYGYIYDFSRRVLVQGGEGEGVLDGTQRGRVITDEPTPHSHFATNFPYSPEDLTRMRPLFEKYRVRCFGSAALNLTYTAIGKLAACVDFRVKLWDVAAGFALIKAAGGEIVYLDEPLFPIDSFHVHMPPVRYVAGSPAFCRVVKECYEASAKSE